MNERQIREAKQLLDGYLIEDEIPTLQTYKLFHDIYEKNLLPIKNNICFSSALVVMLCHLSRPLNWFKFNIYLYQEANKPHIPINVYGMNILRSGGGKGLTTNTMNALLNLKQHQIDYIDDVIDREGNEEEIACLKDIAGAELQDSATTAGLRYINKQLNNCFDELKITNTFGSVFFNLEEFADTLENATKFDKDFLSTLKNLYDLGNTGAKAINDTIKGSIENFGVSFLASTTEKTLQENPQVSREFNKYLISGSARRSLLSMPCAQEVQELEQRNNKDDGLSLLEWHEATRYHDDGQVDDIKKRLYATIKKFIKWKKECETQIYVDNDTYFYYRVYKEYCSKKSEDINNAILKVEMEGRHWKALKISAILLLYCTTEGNIITPNLFLEGIKIVEYYGHHLRRYLNNQVSTCADKIVELLLDSDCAIEKASLSKNNEVLSYNKKGEPAGKFIESQISEVEELLSTMNYELVTQKAGYKNKTTLYAAIKKDAFDNYKIDDKPPYKIFNNIPKMSAEDLTDASSNQKLDPLSMCLQKMS